MTDCKTSSIVTNNHSHFSNVKKKKQEYNDICKKKKK